MNKVFSTCQYRLLPDGRMNPHLKGIPGWPEPKGLLTMRFSGNKRQRRKKFRQFVDFCLDQSGVQYF